MKDFIRNHSIGIIIVAAVLAILLIHDCPSEDTSSSGSSYNNSQLYVQQDYDYYIGNKSTKKYHLPDCSYLPDIGNRVKIPESKIDTTYSAYSPCGHCDP
jgi:hypothetical protein